MSDPNNYVVGWICAIATEYVAARAFLDEEHDGPEYVSHGDNNDYTLGKIGKHNVVVAVLPDEEYGTQSAACVARDMAHSFPNVRIGLMVGIGGGAPTPKNDIRLGDIVVSAPRDGKGGVFQYDLGKTIQDQSFRPTGFLNQPPVALRTAVSGLKAQYESDGHQLEEAISSVLQKKPRLRKKYGRPSLDSDMLYQSTFTHPSDSEASCIDVCSDDASNLILRRERTEEEDIPAIHYGVIASGNQLMKDALLRDKLAKENSILCFEMEAAGLMNHFPCLVIRGICDYSDTHKNKEWQGYAAMAAVAYAKDVLCRIAPTKIEAEKKIRDLLLSVQEDVNEIVYNVRDTRSTVQDISFNQRQKGIERWLSPPDPSTNYNKALKQRQEGTGLWFLQSDVYAQWKMQQSSILWIQGIPGCGKTILSSTLIEDLTTALPSSTLLYFYFDFSDFNKQTLDNMIRSLTSQLYHKCECARKFVDLLYSSCKDGGCQPRCESLYQVFSKMIYSLSNTYIVLDALDECSTRAGSHSEGLLSWIEDLIGSKQQDIHLLVTSRPEQDIQSRLNDIVSAENVIPLESALVTEDINAYIHVKVRKSDSMKRWRQQPDIQDEIEGALMQKANGMFRWAACQIDALENCLDYRTLQHALASLPKTLDETYSRILHAIPPEHKKTATLILQLVAFSERPLEVEEVVDAIAVGSERDPFFCPKYRMPDPRELTRYCSSLVIVVSNPEHQHDINRSSGKVQLAHFSVKEYLTSNRLDSDIGPDFLEPAARGAIAQACLAYILHFKEQLSAYDIVQQYPFADYAARYWMENAAQAKDKDKRLLELIEQLFCYREISYSVCYSLYRPDTPWLERPYDLRSKPASAMYYAALGGLLDTTKRLAKQGTDVNTKGGYYDNALQAASFRGHEAIVKLLVEKGADVNAQGGYYGSALYAAVSEGHETVVKLLVDKGADVNVQGGEYGNALQAASFGGHEATVKLLVEKGADVNAQGGKYGNALQAASFGGHEATVKLLVDKDAGVNAQGGYYGSALYAAVSEGHETVVKLLVDKGADVNVQGGEYGNALYEASSRGHEAIVKLLVDKGAEFNAPTREYSDALYAASFLGNEAIVKLLVDKDTDINTISGDYGNALHAASSQGHEMIVKLLVEKGADVNAPSGDCSYALQEASFEGHETIVKLLVDKGADVNVQGGEYGNALYAASSEGHVAIVKLLVEKGADVNAQGGKYGNALQAASLGGHEAIVKLLVEKGADVNAQGGPYGNALFPALYRGHEAIVKLLVDKGADVNAQDGKYGNALQAASYAGQEAIIELLLEKGADVNAQGGPYSNALQAASYRGLEAIVKLLVEKGADVNAQGEL